MVEMLSTIALLFIIAGPFLLFSNHFGLPTVPLLVVSGIVGGTFVEPDIVLELAQYGVALLVFSFASQIELKAIWSVIVDGELVGLTQIILLGGLGVAFGILVGVGLTEAIFIGIAAALSSTIVGTALIQQEIRMKLIRGRIASSLHFVQDLVAIVILLFLGSQAFEGQAIGTALLSGLSLLGVAVIINRYLFEKISQFAEGSTELMILGVVTLLALFVGGATFLDIPIAVGAFAAGIAIRYDPFDHLGLFNGLQSIRDFFVAIFFITVGALIVIPFIHIPWDQSIEKLVVVSGLVVLTVIIKPLVTTFILMHRGYEARSATLASLDTDQVSEFALIIAIEALILGYLTQSIFDAIILAAAITMITSSLTHRYDHEIYTILSNRGVISSYNHDRIDEWSDVPDSVNDHIIIVGFGRQGHRLAETCEEFDYPYIVIENDPARYDALAAACTGYVIGDAMEDYTWEKASIHNARLIVSTVDSYRLSRRMLSFDFAGDIILRADSRESALALLDEGALHVGNAEILAGEQLVQQIEALLSGDITKEELRSQQMDVLEHYAEHTPIHLG